MFSHALTHHEIVGAIEASGCRATVFQLTDVLGGVMFKVISSIKSVAANLVVLLLPLFALPAFAGTASLAWNASASTSVTGYKVYYGTASGVYPNQLDAHMALSLTVPSLTAGTKYYFAVTAYNSAGESGYSNEASATIPPAADTQAPTTPANLAAPNRSSNMITLAWGVSTDNVGVTAYRVERCQGAGCTSFAQVPTSTGTSTSFSDTGLTASTSYSYRVRAADAAGNLSGYSNVVSPSTAAAADTQAPTAPNNHAAVANGTSAINLTWTASTDNVGVTGYRVERCQGAGCTSFAQVPASTGTSTSFSDTGLTASTTYRYRVRASDMAGNLSEYSGVASASTTAQTSNPLEADFFANRTAGAVPLRVVFSDHSSGTVDTYLWNFGDGVTSTDASPVHTYRKPGSFAVTLTIKGAAGTQTKTRTAYVNAVAANDLVVDFGPASGIWSLKNGSYWNKIDARSARQLVMTDVDHNGESDVVVDLGVDSIGKPLGNWKLSKAGVWTAIDPRAAKNIVVGDVDGNGQDDLVFDFGSQGIWLYANGSNWSQLDDRTAKAMLLADLGRDGRDELVVDFGAGPGIWGYSVGGGWKQIDTRTATWMLTADLDGNDQTDLVLDFGAGSGAWGSPNGVWARFNGATWFQIDPRTALQGAAINPDGNQKEELALSIANVGLMLYSHTTPIGTNLTGYSATNWLQLGTQTAKRMLAADLNTDGKQDLVVDFGSGGVSTGLHKFSSGAWSKIHRKTTNGMVSGQFR
jgi:PKD repeat protein